ncbi:MAG: hypothetical protein WAW03_17095 [Anaerolineae bacterium]|uniref:hypothetical protein n=1 Tax=Candidatus Amarolinea dominans TaxID=3140696 RepID=UPI001E1870F6|nr:hypothetical protein [Anaerolineae bacterium]MBK7203988.1 hypothetical protein [Anaerolineae bacterium]MBK9092204.1 hypothetical protein [Anaerolineae bacterium]MBK9229507.1 hypothetical protein [Anaerolineae bacterium]
MPVPPALLRRFYVEGSLRNRRDGFELRLSNRLAPGTLLGIGPLTVDGRLYTGDDLLLQTRKSLRPAANVSPEHPFDWPLKMELTLVGIGPHLTAGPHRINIGLLLRETGQVTLTIEDTLATPDPTLPASRS